MDRTFKHPLRTFVILTFVLFWILFSITGAAVVSGAPRILQTVLKNLCAWSSTIVLALFYRRFRPDGTFLSFVGKQFAPVGILDFLLPLAVQLAIAAFAVFLVLAVSGVPFSDLRFISPLGALPLLLVNITSGPTGEELGWRGYALAELRKKHSLFVSSILIGVLWGLWHFPLWLVSGYAGTELLAYIGSFMVGIVSFSVFMAFFYSRKSNIGVAVWIHFLFNVLMQLALVDGLKLLLSVALLYLAVTAGIVLGNRKLFFQ